MINKIVFWINKDENRRSVVANDFPCVFYNINHYWSHIERQELLIITSAIAYDNKGDVIGVINNKDI
jgi:hypothetical protein